MLRHLFTLRCLLFLFFLLTPAPASLAEVLRVEVDARVLVLEGHAFGPAGAYELLKGRIYFGFDPANPMNDRIVDLGLAPRNADGLVEAWTDLLVLQPADPARRRGVALVEVSNRGGMAALRYFNRAATALDAADPEAFGDGLLMQEGLTVVWLGWQFDVPERPGLLRLHVPRAREVDGSALYGLARSDWTVDEPTGVLPLAHRDHLPYPAADPGHPANVLTERDGREAPRRVVPRTAWRFARVEGGQTVPDSAHVHLEGGFTPGKIYELTYLARDPAVVGLGLAAIRDVIAYAKHDPAAPFPVRQGVAVGISQTGRFLRHFLYQGFNTDEAGRKAYDGLYVLTAGAGRGSFNHRFAQPSRDAHRYSAFFYPTDLFPFTSRPQRDPLLQRTDGLLAHLHATAHAPRTFFVNTGYEYWGRAAALLHVSPDGARDVAPMPHERIYHLASAQHFPLAFPLSERAREPAGPDAPARYRGNPIDLSATYRALLVRLIAWVADGETPPPSAYPRLADHTLASPYDVVFPALPGIVFPRVAHAAYRADYGPRWEAGIIDLQPPLLGTPFPVLVARVDSLGNELGGLPQAELRVPVATYLPWNLRTGMPGRTDELTDFYGSYLPFAPTEAERMRTGDPRPSLEALYDGRAGYLARVRDATGNLVQEGFLLETDRQRALDRAALYWEWIRSK